MYREYERRKATARPLPPGSVPTEAVTAIEHLRLTAWCVLRAVGIVVGTWVLLVAVPAPILLLPERWQYDLISPATVALWMLCFLIAPTAVCFATAQWITTGRRKPRRSTTPGPQGRDPCEPPPPGGWPGPVARGPPSHGPFTQRGRSSPIRGPA